MNLPDCFITHPAVFAVGNEYQIMLPVSKETLVWVRCGGKEYYDHSNGILRSKTPIHRVTVPMEVLDAAEGYTLCYREVYDRKVYFPEVSDTHEVEYKFKPLKKTEGIRILHLADTHGRIDDPVESGAYFGGDIDLLILNGDIADHSGSVENLLVMYHLASRLTGGTVPCVFSRGNHDLRGACAEQLEQYTPNSSGNTYYTFRVGCIWGIVIDSGEDKEDDHPEYGHTICCHSYRRQVSDYIKQVIKNSGSEYAADGVKYRLIVSHVPFFFNQGGPFTIDVEVMTEWCDLMKQSVKPQLALCGHLHELGVDYPGGRYDHKGQPCPVVVGALPWSKDRKNIYGFTSASVTLNGDGADVVFANHLSEVEEQHQIKF